MTREELIAELEKLPAGTEVFLRQERNWFTGMFLSHVASTPRVRTFEVGGRHGPQRARAFLEVTDGPQNAVVTYAGDMGCPEWTF